MIKVFHWKLENKENNNKSIPSCNIELNNNNLIINFSVPHREEYISKSVSFNTSINSKVYDVFFKETTGYDSIDIIDMFEYCDRNGFDINNNRDKKIMRVIIDDKSDVYIIFHYQSLDIKGVENITMTKGKPSSYYARKYCVWFEELQKRVSKKYKMVKHLDCYASISYLEAQVDILTRILLNTLDKDSEYYNVLKKADEKSVLNIKPSDDLINEFIEQKSKVRKYQEQYYEVLNG